MSVNESEKVDVTRDDYYDLEVILNAIEDNKVDLTINSIREAVPIVETTAPDVDEKSEERSRSLLWLWIVIGVIIFGIIVFILYNKKKK